MARPSTLPVPLRLARRELRGGLHGFRILLACLALGVAAIAGAGSLNQSIQAGLANDARRLLGGDLEIEVQYQPATDAQIAVMRQAGTMSHTVEMRAMARLNAEDGGRMLVEMKGVDDTYPLYGEVVLSGGLSLSEALDQRDGRWGTVVAENLLTRLGAEVGDTLRVGAADLEIRAVIEEEPDQMVRITAFGPRLMVANAAIPDTDLIQPGSLVEYVYKIRADGGPLSVAQVRDILSEDHDDVAWQFRDLGRAAPGLGRFLRNLTVFLTLVGLTALLVGGIGVANGIKAYMDGKLATIATLKCVGASSRLIFQTYLAQVMILTALGVLIGLVLGAVAPMAALEALANVLPVRAQTGVYLEPLALAAAFGFLTSAVFALWPLATAGQFPAQAIFRNLVVDKHIRPPAAYVWALIVLSWCLVALAVLSSESMVLAAYFCVFAAAAMALFWVAAKGVVHAAKAWSHRRRTRGGRASVRLAFASLHRPGNVTTPVVLSLGLGLTVLVCVALIEGNMGRQIREDLPQEAPAMFLLDIQPTQIDSVIAIIEGTEGSGEHNLAPMVRGPITMIGGRPVDEVEIDREVSWAVRGDRGLSSAAMPPDNARLVQGAWWDAAANGPDYDGPNLVSLDDRLARGFGMELGDTLTVNVLGRDLTATLANTRDINWTTGQMNFTFVFNPPTLANVPHTFLGTVQASDAATDAIEAALVEQHPNVSVIRVKQAMETVNLIISQSADAIRAVAAVTLLAGGLVLAGAVAAGHSRRIYDSVVLKVLGATRSNVLSAYVLEYGAIGVATGIIASGIGTLAAWAVMTQVMQLSWTLLPGVVVATVIGCAVVTIGFGFVGTWRAMGAKAAPLLRNE